MKIVLLGGSGFIGTAVAERLLRDGHELKVFGRRPPNAAHPLAGRVEWVCGDFGPTTDFSGLLADANALVHLISATVPKTSMDDPWSDVQINLGGTLRVLQQAASSALKKIIFVSSGGTVYGAARTIPISEQHPTEPMVSYGIVKLAIEKYLQMYSLSGGIPTTVLRVSNPYGEGQVAQAAQGAVGAFLRSALAHRSIEVWGDGSVVRDYIHVDDVAHSVSAALVHSGTFSIFNIGSGVGMSLNDILDCIERVLGRPVSRTYMPARAIDVPVNVLDCSSAARELGWSAQIGLDEGLRRTARWIAGNQNLFPPSHDEK